MNKTNFRREVLDNLAPYFKKDKRYHLLVCDMGFEAAGLLKRLYPGRVVNCGIMEQATVGIAAGMSMSGMVPIVYSIVNFLAFRALEQIRNDVILQGLNVKFIATGVNDYFYRLGASHCCGQDDSRIMRLIKMKVYDPYSSGVDFKVLIKKWVLDDSPGYLRV